MLVPHLLNLLVPQLLNMLVPHLLNMLVLHLLNMLIPPTPTPTPAGRCCTTPAGWRSAYAKQASAT